MSISLTKNKILNMIFFLKTRLLKNKKETLSLIAKSLQYPYWNFSRLIVFIRHSICQLIIYTKKKERFSNEFSIKCIELFDYIRIK